MFTYTTQQQKEYLEGRKDARNWKVPKQPSTQPYREGFESIIKRRTSKKGEIDVDTALQSLETHVMTPRGDRA